jgi:hypothetical protein
MKAVYPVSIGLTAFVILSALIAVGMPTISVLYPLSWILYLGLCLAQVAHSIEEYYTQFWVHIGEGFIFQKLKGKGVVKDVTLDKRVFFVGNIVLNALMLAYVWPIASELSWAWFFGIAMAVVGIGNGILHCGTTILEKRYYSGSVTGIITLIMGAIMLIILMI